MRVVDIIMKKRGTFVRKPDGSRIQDGSTVLTKDEIKYMIDGYVSREIPDYQISSWLMAVYFNGMTFEETGYMTDCMLHSGKVIELHGYKGLQPPFIDKHSTGGVGDKVSLPLAPIVAECGIQIPMMSGRALGHTGGTLDKLESIDGYHVGLEPDEFRRLIAENGYAMTGQTEEIVPADRLLYELRDVTGTVESVPLITSSILSKKVAEGSDGLVFDVKYGSGAFMKTTEDAEILAESLVKTSSAMGKKAAAVITDMNTPLGRKIGNFLEVEETLDCLECKGPEDVMKITYTLGAYMLILGGKVSSLDDGIEKCRQAVQSGNAMKRFLVNVKAQGGNPEKLLSQRNKRRSPYHARITAAHDGYIFIDAYKTGLAGVNLGVGRNKTDEQVCPDAGIILNHITGDYVEKGELIMDIYGKDEECLSPASKLLKKAITYTTEKQKKVPLIYKEITE